MPYPGRNRYSGLSLSRRRRPGDRADATLQEGMLGPTARLSATQPAGELVRSSAYGAGTYQAAPSRTFQATGGFGLNAYPGVRTLAGLDLPAPGLDMPAGPAAPAAGPGGGGGRGGQLRLPPGTVAQPGGTTAVSWRESVSGTAVDRELLERELGRIENIDWEAMLGPMGGSQQYWDLQFGRAEQRMEAEFQREAQMLRNQAIAGGWMGTPEYDQRVQDLQSRRLSGLMTARGEVSAAQAEAERRAQALLGELQLGRYGLMADLAGRAIALPYGREQAYSLSRSVGGTPGPGAPGTFQAGEETGLLRRKLGIGWEGVVAEHEKREAKKAKAKERKRVAQQEASVATQRWRIGKGGVPEKVR